jgi:hypothetical protein
MTSLDGISKAASREGSSERQLMKVQSGNPLSRDFDFVSITLSP